ncbi:MAG: hypothetical protein JRJ39_00495 [Deltaproteobacteria bacterium]|nr:hypothetical protein [Deltaproteobacteria bacterium]MBW1845588.1 hypothetical protein [Deltaproteobacteria bacterium]MBW2032016.1 hypothetical protein [Deltaproteobacteria bacterium]
MGLTAKDPGGSDNFEPVPAGAWQAVCIAVVDIGTQINPLFNKEIYKVLIMWEFPEHRIDISKEGEPENDMPMVISKLYRLSLHQKANLRQDLEAWRQKPFSEEELQGFDLSKLLGVNANIQVVHVTKKTSSGDKTYANINAIMGLMKNQTKLEPDHDIVIYEIDSGDMVPDSIPDWIANLVRTSPEYQKLHPDQGQYQGSQQSSDIPPGAETGDPGYDDDTIPF